MREGESFGFFTIASKCERLASLDQILEDSRKNGSVLVFGYESLMRNVTMHKTGKRLGRVFRVHRCYCISSPIGRSMSEKLGLTLRLDQGGSVTGITLHLDRKSEEEELSIL